MPNVLENEWTIWRQLPSKKDDVQSYLSGMEEVCKFGSVESFWKSYLNLPPIRYFKYNLFIVNYFILKELERVKY